MEEIETRISRRFKKISRADRATPPIALLLPSVDVRRGLTNATVSCHGERAFRSRNEKSRVGGGGGVASERRERRREKHGAAHSTCRVRVGARARDTHARANSRSNARVSQSRIADFSHTWFA